MRHLLSICIALLFLGGVSLQAQNGVRGTVSFENVSARKDGSQLMMNFTQSSISSYGKPVIRAASSMDMSSGISIRLYYE